MNEPKISDCGHGHVYPRADGVKAHCGGVRSCAYCFEDLVNARVTLKLDGFKEYVKRSLDDLEYTCDQLAQYDPNLAIIIKKILDRLSEVLRG